MKGFSKLNFSDASTASNTTTSNEVNNMNANQEMKLKRSSPTKKQRDASQRQLARIRKNAEEKSINQCLDHKPGKYYRLIANHKNTLCSYDWFQVNINATEKQYNIASKRLKKQCGIKWKTDTKPKRRRQVENFPHIDCINSASNQAKRDGYDFGYSITVEDSSSPIIIYFKKRKNKNGVEYSIGFKINPSHHCIASTDNAVKALEGIHKKFIRMIISANVTRIDCAIDIFNMNIRNFFYIPKSLQKTFVAIGRNQELEYIRHGNRKNGVVIYDKAAEIRDKPKRFGGREHGTYGKRTKPLGDMTRIEFSTQINITTKDFIKEKYWPDFSTLQCYEISKIYYPDRFFMELSQIIGLHTNLKKLAPSDRKDAMQRLKEAQVSLPVNNEGNVSFEQASLIVRYMVGSIEERQSIRQMNPGKVSQYIHSGLITKQLMEFSTDFTNEFNEAQILYLKEITPNYEEIEQLSKSKRKSKFPLGLPVTRDEAIRLISLRKFK